MGRVSRSKQASASLNRTEAVQLGDAEYRILKLALEASEQAKAAAAQVTTVARALFKQAQTKYHFDGDVSWTFDDATCRLVPVTPQPPPK